MSDPVIVTYVALGSNGSESITDNAEILLNACQLIENIYGHYIKKSAFYQTPAFPKGNGPDFVNAVIGFETASPPDEILQNLHQIEADLGRIRQKRWGQRVIDLDLIAQGQTILPDLKTHTHWRDLSLEQQMSETPEMLLLPHPRLQDRAFVLGPMKDIAPNWVHPILNLSVQEMWDALDEAAKAELRPLETSKMSGL